MSTWPRVIAQDRHTKPQRVRVCNLAARVAMRWPTVCPVRSRARSTESDLSTGTLDACGALPEPLEAMMPSPPPREYSGKQSPPIPVEPASTTHGTAQPAIAASLALPPASGVFTAASVEAECEVAAMPSFDIT